MVIQTIAIQDIEKTVTMKWRQCSLHSNQTIEWPQQIKEKTASKSGDGKRDSIIIQNIESDPECREDSEHEMKIKFSTFKPEDEMVTANSLYQSASGVTVVAGPKAVTNPLYESANTVTGNLENSPDRCNPMADPDSIVRVGGREGGR